MGARSEGRLELSDSKSTTPPTHITNNLPLVASLLASPFIPSFSRFASLIADYDTSSFRSEYLASIAASEFLTVPTPRYTTLDSKANVLMMSEVKLEIARREEEERTNLERARKGKQLDETVSAFEAASKYELPPNTHTTMSDSISSFLTAPLPYAVIDLPLPNISTSHTASLDLFAKLGDAHITAQSSVRGDNVYFLPLFSPYPAPGMSDVKSVLSNVGRMLGDADLKVPKVSQLAMYDGGEERPGYVPHFDNVGVLGEEGEVRRTEERRRRA